MGVVFTYGVNRSSMFARSGAFCQHINIVWERRANQHSQLKTSNLFLVVNIQFEVVCLILLSCISFAFCCII